MVTEHRNHERITNEARALELVLQKTNIPVPRLLDHGSHPDGRRYLVTEFIEGLTLNEFPNRSCSKPKGQKHTNDTPCKCCSDQAYSNALEFISGTVLPQLATLRSQSRGIDGFVMPPSWLSPDLQPPWIGKECWKTLPLKLPEYIFQHGDLAAHNIIMDTQTLEVKALVDWEYAGFYPPGMEGWPGTLCADAYNRRGNNKDHLIKQFLATEYLECYDKWSDKVELHELIKLGELPHPDQMRLAGTED
jgi:serine/threonine protein kinase